MLPLQGEQVPSLVGELRSCISCSSAKKKKKEQLKLANQPDMGLRGALVYCENSNVSTWILEKVIHSGAAGEQEKRCGYETLEKWRLFVTTA